MGGGGEKTRGRSRRKRSRVVVVVMLVKSAVSLAVKTLSNPLRQVTVMDRLLKVLVLLCSGGSQPP